MILFGLCTAPVAYFPEGENYIGFNPGGEIVPGAGVNASSSNGYYLKRSKNGNYEYGKYNSQSSGGSLGIGTSASLIESGYVSGIKSNYKPKKTLNIGGSAGFILQVVYH